MRVQTFFGKEGFKKISNSYVIVVGLGGVGSHCANMLVRSGIKKIKIIDFDQVTLSSLNRHAVATLDDVGTSKAQTLKSRLLEVVPWCDIICCNEIFKGSEAERLIDAENNPPDYVVDCIDDLHTKGELIAYCMHRNLPILTSMGAGGKADPTRLRVAPLSDCINDPLASKLKWKLKKLGVSPEDVTSVFSVEKPVCSLLPLSDEQAQAPQDYGNVDYMRVRVMPVLGTTPSIFGQALASYTLCELAGKSYMPEVCERMSVKLKKKIMQVARNNENKRFGTSEELSLDDYDIEFIAQQVWRGRCAITEKRFGGHITLTLTRWFPEKPPTPYNLVLMMQTEADKLNQHGHAAFSKEVQNRIADRLLWAEAVCQGSWEDRSEENLDVSGKNHKLIPESGESRGTSNYSILFASTSAIFLQGLMLCMMMKDY